MRDLERGLPAWPVAAFLLAACAGAQAPGTAQPESAAASAELGVDEMTALEAQIVEQDAVAARATGCEEGCRAEESICDSASRICQIAAELAEADAMDRCRRAQATCESARGRIVERCLCRRPY